MRYPYVPVVCAGLLATFEATAARGQTVDFRIVERTGQTVVSAGDNVLDFAIQARVTSVTGTVGLGGFAFDAIHFVGDAEPATTFARGRISNSDGTYDPTIGISSTVGRGGLAASYAYYAGLNAAFNGSFNMPVGPLPNGPDGEIVGVLGAARSQYLLSTPGVDTDADGVPDTGTGPLPHSIMQQYFGAGQYIDIYRFRVTVNDLTTPRVVPIQFEHPVAESFTRLQTNLNDWAAQIQEVPAASINLTTAQYIVLPAPSGAMAIGLAALVAARRRRD